jgi:hypothetical protein
VNVFGARKGSGVLKIAIIIDPWKRDLMNYLLFFISDKRKVLKNIKKFVIEEKIDLVVVASYDNIPVDKIILSIPNTKVFTTKLDDVKALIKENNVKEIYMCGMAWDKCVKFRELGYLSLHKNTNVNILVKDDCVLCDEEHPARMFVPNENPEWKKFTNFGIYKYEP